jgi:hypothetical protein
MEIITLLVNLLTPHLPFLMGLGQKAMEKGSEKLGEKGAEEIWNKLSPQIKTEPGVLAVAKDVAQNPDNAMAKTTLAYHLEKMLNAPENAVLKAEIIKILEKETKTTEGKFIIEAKDSQIGAIGDHSKVIMNFGPKP